MAQYCITYTTTVVVTVDTESREVTSVSVDDENITFNSGAAWDAWTCADLTGEQLEEARAIADGDAMWPGWEFG